MQERIRRQRPWLKAQALGWLARLPFLSAYQMSLILGITEKEAEWLLHDLEELHWLDQITPLSPYLDPKPHYVLAQAAIDVFADGIGVPLGEVEAKLPTSWRDLMRRLSRLETSVYLNQIFADLVRHLVRDGRLGLAELMALPAYRHPSEARWRPRGVEGYGCLKDSDSWAPFFVAMENVDAPRAHRNQRIADWYTFRDAEHGWGDYWLPPIFIVAAGPKESEQWGTEVVAAADRRLVNNLDVYLADEGSVLSHGFMADIWHKPTDGRKSSPWYHLAWRRDAPTATFSRWLPTDEPPPLLPPSPFQLQAWANQTVVGLVKTYQPKGTSEELAALSLVLGEMEERALETLGSHPMLTARELGVVLKQSHRRAERLAASLQRYHLVECLPPIEGDAGESRLLLTELALKLLAARDGVPFSTYARHGFYCGRTGDREAEHRLGPLLHHPEHTAGINRFFVSLGWSAPGACIRLTKWVTVTESTYHLTHDGVRNWLQPDGVGDLSWRNQTRRFFLEWDRGTMGWPEMNEKFRRYASLYSTRASPPDTVIVTSSPQRESSIWERWRQAMDERDCPPSLLLTTVQSLLERLGPFASIWRTSIDLQQRRTWGEAIDLWDDEYSVAAEERLEESDD